MRIGILTGGGDVPGLNPCIKAVVNRAEDAGIEVRRLWLEGKREEAARRVPDEMILRTTLIGPESRIRERLRAYRDAGIGILRIEPLGGDDGARLDALGRAVELIRQSS